MGYKMAPFAKAPFYMFEHFQYLSVWGYCYDFVFSKGNFYIEDLGSPSSQAVVSLLNTQSESADIETFCFKTLCYFTSDAWYSHMFIFIKIRK